MIKTENKFFLLLGLLLFAALIYFISPILSPFIIGAFLAYLFNPLVKKLDRLNLPHRVSIAIVFSSFIIVVVSLLLLLVPLIQNQIENFTDIIPNTIEWIQTTINPWLQDNFGVSGDVINVGSLKKVIAENMPGGNAAGAVKAIFSSGVKVMEGLINFILTPVVAFYLLCDWGIFLKSIQDLVPRRQEPTFTRLMRECDHVLSAFLRGQLLVMLALGFIYALGLTVVGLKVGVIVGVIAGLLSIVPYLGTISGVFIGVVAAYMQTHDLQLVVLALIVFAIGHLIENMYLTPKLVGDRIGMHPVAVIFCILAGGCLFGFIGILLALPLGSVVMVWLRHIHKRYQRSRLYQA